MNLKERLAIQPYDKYYQDIECINFIGYANSYKTWENIKNLVDWTDKIVVDVGCFHGYFCLKAEQAGARFITGIDKNNITLQTTQQIAKMSNSSKCAFICLDANDIYPHSDILLCLNVFHHIKDQDAFFKNISADKIIMEIDKEDLPKVEKHCRILVNKLSHRASAYTGDTPNRLVLLVEKL